MKISLFMTLLLLTTWAMATKEVTLTEVTRFGSNPGRLKMFYYSPKKLDPKAPLIVLLHGCTQSASEFDDETGWTALADKKGALLVLPQQTESNNQSRCFNWFLPSQTSRGRGEAHSIAEMVEEMKKLFNIDHQQVFITGLSAGAAMSAVMISAYPEMFTGAALVAGIPYGCASNAFNAWTCMYAQDFPPTSPSYRASSVRRAFDHTGPYPRVLVIQGSRDELVNPRNGRFNFEQWVHVHELQDSQPRVTRTSRFDRMDYQAKQKNIVSFISLKNMPHGYPVDPKKGCGKTSKYIINAGICGTDLIAQFFDL